MNYLQFILLMLLPSFIFFSCKKDEEVPFDKPIEINPNILLIIADDLGLDATPGYSEGVTKPNMPNLDKLAANGIRFNNAWASPLCSPTRATILTGKYGSRTGILSVENASINNSEISIQRFLDTNNDSIYSHALIGKWHLSNKSNITAPNDLGIGYYAGFLQGALNDYHNWNLTINGKTETCTDYNTTKLTDLTIDWIKNQEKPWFCWLAYSAAHTPLHYPPTEMHNQSGDVNDSLAMFLAMIESIDYEIGRILDSLDKDIIDNTIIIFIGDNGTDKNVLQLPYRGRKAKGSLYQGGINVPLIVSGKGVSRQNCTDESLICSSDLFATIANIAGVDLNKHQDSYSFKDLLSIENTHQRAFNFSEINNNDNYSYAITDGKYKFIKYTEKESELYNIIDDPYERTNLFNSTNTSDITAKNVLIQEANNILNK